MCFSNFYFCLFVLPRESIYTLSCEKVLNILDHVICSETCPHNECPGHPRVCQCDHGCSVNDKCELLHHAEKEGAFKKVIFGIIGPDDYVDEVHTEMKRLKYDGGVYTLMISKLINKRGRKSRNNTEDVMREVDTMEQIKKIVPLGRFTPTILFSKRLERGSKDFNSLQRINANIVQFKKMSRKHFIGHHIEDVIPLSLSLSLSLVLLLSHSLSLFLSVSPNDNTHPWACTCRINSPNLWVLRVSNNKHPLVTKYAMKCL